MHAYRFGRKLKLPSTSAIKHQIRKAMFEALVRRVEAPATVETILGQQSREESRPLVQPG
jgi:hypothetical protein